MPEFLYEIDQIIYWDSICTLYVTVMVFICSAVFHCGVGGGGIVFVVVVVVVDKLKSWLILNTDTEQVYEVS